MPIQPSDIDALPTYTAAQQLKMWQKASIDLAAAGQSVAINGRTLTRSDAGLVQRMIDYWRQQAYAEANPGQNPVALADFSCSR